MIMVSEVSVHGWLALLLLGCGETGNKADNMTENTQLKAMGVREERGRGGG